MSKLTKTSLSVAAVAFLVAFASGCSPKAKAARHQKRGDAYFAAGHLSKAEVEYLNVFHLEHGNTHAVARLGSIYYDQGRFSRAYAFLTNACALDPNDLDLRMKLGSLYLSAGSPKQARAQANFILDRMPGHAEAPVLLAESALTPAEIDAVILRLERLRAQGGNRLALPLAVGTTSMGRHDHKTAEAAFQQALALEPNSSSAHFAMGQLRLAQHDLPAADLELRTAAELAPPRSNRKLAYANLKLGSGDLEGGKRLLLEITRQAPDYVPVWTRLAEISLAERDLTNCAALLDHVSARDPGNFEASLLKSRLLLAQGEAPKAIAELDRLASFYETVPQVHYQLALAHLLDNNDTAKAYKSVNRALALNTNFDDAILLKAQINLARDEIDVAIPSLSALLQRQPRMSQAALLLAAAYRSQGNLEQALATYRRLEEVSPNNPDTPFLSAQIYAQQNKKSEARAGFTRTLERAPGFQPALEALVGLDVRDKQFTQAIARVQQEISKAPSAPGLQLLLAKAYAAQPDTARAEAALLKALELGPDLLEPYVLLAQLYVGADQFKKALGRLEEAIARKPTDVTALMLIGTIQEKLKDYPAARTAYEKLLAANPGFYPALNNLAYLYAEQFGLLDKAYELARKANDIAAFKPKSAAADNQTHGRHAAQVQLLRAFSTDTLGWINLKRGDFSLALNLLRESASVLKDEPEVQFHLAMAYYMLGKEPLAQEAFKRSLALNQGPGTQLSEAVDQEIKRRLSVLTTDARTATPATVGEWEKNLKAQPEDPIVLSRLAAIYERDGTPAKTLSACEASLRKSPKSIVALKILVDFYSRPGPSQDRPRALELAKDAARLAPDDQEITVALGRLALETGDHKWALSLLQPAASKQSGDAEVLYDLARAYYMVGRVRDAETGMKAALDAGGAFSRAADAKTFLDLIQRSASPANEILASEILRTNQDYVPALMLAGLCAQQRNDRPAARRRFERVATLCPDFAPAAKQLALLYSELGESQRAYEMANKARQALPDDPDVAKTLGILLYERKDYRNCARLLLESVQKGREDSATMYYLGSARYQLKEWKESKLALERALALNIEAERAESARRILAELARRS